MLIFSNVIASPVAIVKITVLCIVSLDVNFNDLFVYNAHNAMYVME